MTPTKKPPFFFVRRWRTVSHLRTAVLLLCIFFGLDQRIHGFLIDASTKSRTSVLYSSADRSELTTKTIQERLDERRNQQLIVASFPTPLTDVHLVGQAKIRTTSTDSFQDCAVLTRSSDAVSAETTSACLLVPLSPPQLKLLQYAAWNRPQSTTTLLASLNPLFLNRDHALFDNLPWATWTIDPDRQARDAAGKVVASIFSMGKRDAYNRFLGKDWNGAQVIHELLSQGSNSMGDSSENKEDAEFAESQALLARRILELQLREAQMDLAEIESDLAIAKQQQSDLTELEYRQEMAVNALQNVHARMQELASNTRPSQTYPDLLTKINRSRQSQKPPPYRGATGYDPRRSDSGTLRKSYCSPYDLLNEVLRDQLQAEVIGAVLENSSLLQTVVGGAIVLRRLPKRDSISIAGETLTMDDSSNDLGNPNVTGGTTIVVECDADEAISMALACGLPVKVETDLFERANVMCKLQESSEHPTSAKTALPYWLTMDSNLSILAEGQMLNQSTTESILAVRTPNFRSLFDTFFDPRAPSSSVFPTDNPIQALGEYDSLSSRDKAQTLQSLSNFDGRLPRPRILREQPEALDNLLIPLIDESVRRQYLIRDAMQRGDMETVQQLESTKSRRQIAKEKAATARYEGADEAALYWENEARFLETLRADETQDEDSYSQWLDRDEWYERRRASMAKKVDKSKFGTLLDGFDL
jgi:hypothetical protein